MRPLALLLLLLLSPTAAAAGRTFDWVVVEPIAGNASPMLVRSCLALGPQGPVRARLERADWVYASDPFGDCRVELFDGSGQPLWSASLSGKVSVGGLVVDATGAIVVQGRFRDTVEVDPVHRLVADDGSTHEFLLRFDASHAVEWLFDAAQLDSDLIRIEAVTVDPLNRVWVGGRLNSPTGPGSAIWRLDANGAVVVTYEQDHVEGVTGLAVDAVGRVWACGPARNVAASFNGYAVTPPHTYNSYVANYAADGQSAWVRFVEDVTFQELRVATDGTGRVYFAGQLFEGFAFGGLIAQGPDWVYGFFLTRLDADGDFLWLREVPAGILGDAGHGKSAYVTCPNDTSVCFAGFSRGSVDWFGDGSPQPGYGSGDVLVMQFSSAGDLRWVKIAGSPGSDVADAVVMDAGGTAYVAGQVSAGSHFDTQAFGGSFLNAFLAALPPAPVTAVGPQEPDAGLGARAGPSPFAATSRIAFRLSAPGSVHVAVYDLRGARVATLAEGWRDAGEQAVTWNGRDASGHALPAGVYLVRIETPLGTARRRLVLVR